MQNFGKGLWMNDLYLALTVVFPLFFMMALGYYLNSRGMFTEDFLTRLNKLCFSVLLPFVLFLSIYNSDFSSQFSFGFVAYGSLAIFIAFLLLMFLIPKMVKENVDRGVVIQDVFRSNFVLFGIPVTQAIYGNDNISTTAILIAFVVPLFNILSVIALSAYSKEKKNLKDVIINILKNPLIISSMLGFIFAISGVKLPSLVVSSMSTVSQMASPLALIALGAGFKFSNVTKYLNQLVIIVLGKLVVLPLITLGVAVYLGFREKELVALMVMLATPVAVSSYTMAQSAGANEELAGQAVVMSSLLSVLTVFLWIFSLKSFGFI